MKISSKEGFTLIELMVVIVLVAIIAAIALPSYQNFVRRNNVAECQAIALNISQDLSSWLLKYKSYTGYEPKPDQFSSSSTGQYFLPDNDSTDFNCMLQIVNGDGKPLTNEDSVSRQWHIYGMPNTADRIMRTADAFYLNSAGTSCRLTRQDNPKMPSNAQIIATDCDESSNNRAVAW